MFSRSKWKRRIRNISRNYSHIIYLNLTVLTYNWSHVVMPDDVRSGRDLSSGLVVVGGITGGRKGGATGHMLPHSPGRTVFPWSDGPGTGINDKKRQCKTR